jgi:hypothetical protein
VSGYLQHPHDHHARRLSLPSWIVVLSPVVVIIMGLAVIVVRGLGE